MLWYRVKNSFKKKGLVTRLHSSYRTLSFINTPNNLLSLFLQRAPIWFWVLYLPFLKYLWVYAFALSYWCEFLQHIMIMFHIPSHEPVLPATEYKCAQGGSFIILGSVEFQELWNYLYQWCKCQLSFNKSLETAMSYF